MFNWIFEKWRKKGDQTSYEELEQRLLASNFSPMKPEPHFAASLKDRLLSRFESRAQAASSGAPFFKKILYGGAVALVIIVVAGAIFFTDKTPFGPSVDLVKASDTDVPVNFPVRVAFPFGSIDQEELKKHFSIMPAVSGQVSLKDGILTFDTSKNLEYATKYTIRVKDFEISFTTKKRFQNALYLYSSVDMSYITMNAYDATPTATLNVPQVGEYTATMYSSTPEKLLTYIADMEKLYSSGGDINENRAKFVQKLKTSVVSTQKTTATQAENSGPVIKFTPKIEETGLYFVELTAPVQGKYDDGKYRFFLDYAQTAVSSKRIGSLLSTWVVDMKTGASVPGAAVKAYDNKGKVLFDEKTDEKGLHTLVVDQKNTDTSPSLFVIDTGKEKLVQLLRVQFRSIFMGDPWNDMSQTYRGYAMVDRPLYTPGDTVHFKAMLRKIGQNTFDGSIKNATVEVVREEYGATKDSVFKKVYPVSATGTFAGDFALGSELRTGDYTLKVLVDNEVAARKYFGVEVYQKPDFEVTVTSEKDRYIAGDPVKISVAATYYFGSPVANENVKLSVSSNNFQSKISGIEGTLGADGTFVGTLPSLDIGKDVFNTWYWWGDDDHYVPMLLTARVTEKSGKTVSKNAVLKVYRSAYSVALENRQDLWRVKPREKVDLNFRVNDVLKQGELTGVKGAQVSITIEKRSRGYLNKPEEPIVTNAKVTTDSFGKATFSHEFAVGGSYYITYSVTDPAGRTDTQNHYIWIPDAKYGVYYDESLPSTVAQVGIISDKEKYKIGEKARITLLMPQRDGDVFVSMNTGELKNPTVQEITDRDETIEVEITQDLVPGFNMFAEVFNGDSFFTGTRYIEVSGKKLNVALSTTQEQYYPKEEVRLNVKVTDENGAGVASEGAISVVDKALLALRNFSDLSLFDTFYPKPNEYLLQRFTSLDPFSVGAGEMGGCFTAGTQILMADGTTKSIEFIKKGDVILTRQSEFSDTLVADKVVRTFVHRVQGYMVINGSLKVTPVHRMFINGQWNTAGNIEVGDWLVNAQGRRTQVRSIEKAATLAEVYNFETQSYHTYFADGIYVHNDKGGGDSRPRTDFVDTAFWDAYVQTGASGEGSVKFSLPDNLTTWVALGKNITKDTQVGEGETEFTVNKDLFARPNLPLFVRVGDQLQLPVSLHNTTAQPLNVKALIKVTGAKVQDETLRELSLATREVKQVVWQLAVNEAKNLKLELSVNQVGGKLVDNVVHSIPIYPALTPHRTVVTGVSPAAATFAVDTQNISSSSTGSIMLTPSVVGILPEVIEKLTGYPYGCVEQTMSKHLPNVLAKKYKDILGITLPPDTSKNLKAGLDRLQKYQHVDGSFGWWEGDEANVWMTGYVLEGMLEMKQAGALTGYESMYERTIEYVKAHTSPTNVALKTPLEYIYFSYVLSRTSPKEVGFTIDDAQLQNLPPEFLGYVALTNYNHGLKKEARRIVDSYIMPQLKNNHWEQADDLKDGHDRSMSDKYLATGVNLQALMQIGGADEAKIKGIVQWLMQNRNGYEGLWGSTRQSSQVLFALLAFVEKYQELAPNFSYTVELNGKELDSGRVTRANFNKKIDVPVAQLKANNSVNVKVEGTGSLYYTVNIKNFVNPEKIPLTTAARETELAVERSYLKDGKEVTEFRVGDVLMVQLRVRTKNALRYAMVEDSLPAGFDVINDRLKDSTQDTGYEYNYDEFGEMAPRGGYYWSDPVDIRDERVTLFNEYIWPRENSFGHTFTYRVRVSRAGTYSIPAPRVEGMYDPEIFAVGKQMKITVK